MNVRLLVLTIGLLVAGQPVRADQPESNGEPIDEVPIEPFDRDHWSFRPIGNPQVPAVTDKSWPRTPIDHFVLRRMEHHQTKKRSLLRPLSISHVHREVIDA